MALTPEHRALLELALSRGLSDEEIGDLTGTGAADARARTRAALMALGGADPGDAVGAFLLGRAGEAQRAEAVATLERDRDANALARRLRSALVLAVHGAEPPEVPQLADPGGGVRAKAAAGSPPNRDRLVIAVALAGLCLLVGGLAVAGVFSGDEDPVEAPMAEQPQSGDQEVARIELGGAGGTDARGSVAIGAGADNTPYLDVDLQGLEPASGEGLHMLWVDVDGGRGLPLPDPIVVARDGTFQERFTLPLELVGILEVGRALEVVLTDRATIERVSREVTRAGERSRQGELNPTTLPRRPGEAVLRGRISA